MGGQAVLDGRDFKAPRGYENGNFIGGSRFDGVTTDMTIWREEIFGPVPSDSNLRRLRPTRGCSRP